jgi:G3E family GTPase
MQQASVTSPLVMTKRLKPIPVTIISGFLGAGKTTLLNHILSENHGLKAAVLVNDFGAINIDAKMIVGIEEDAINLANGCICCDIRDDLVSACLGLLKRSEPPDYLIIEASGVSNPLQIANTFLLPELQCILALDSILCVVDCEQFPGLLGESCDLSRMQIAVADILILNKTDLVNVERLQQVKSMIGEHCRGSKVIEASYGTVPLSLILETGVSVRAGRTSSVVSEYNEHFHHSGFSTWHWSSDRPLSLQKLRSFFELLPEKIYRAKGLCYLEELPEYRVILQKVGKRSSIREGSRWGSECPRTELVLIGINGAIDGEAMRIALNGCICDSDEELSPLMRRMREIASSGVES